MSQRNWRVLGRSSLGFQHSCSSTICVSTVLYCFSSTLRKEAVPPVEGYFFHSCSVSFLCSASYSLLLLLSFFQPFPFSDSFHFALDMLRSPVHWRITADPLPITTPPSASLPHFLHHWMISLFIRDRNLPC